VDSRIVNSLLSVSGMNSLPTAPAMTIPNAPSSAPTAIPSTVLRLFSDQPSQRP
jgi:hypothetical protein